MSNCRGFEQSAFTASLSSIKKLQKTSISVMQSSFWGRDLHINNGIQMVNSVKKQLYSRRATASRVFAMSSINGTTFKMNLNEYMVTLEKPLGIRFALSVDGKFFVHALQKGVSFSHYLLQTYELRVFDYLLIFLVLFILIISF